MSDRPAVTAWAGAEAAARLPDCRALWLALRDHHRASDPALGPVRGDEESWALASRKLAAGLGQDDAFLVLAGAPPVGAAVVTIDHGGPTWRKPARCGFVEMLAVSPAERGAGVGAALMEAVQAQLDQRGVSECRLAVTTGNLGAQAFYRELGFEAYQVLLRRGR